MCVRVYGSEVGTAITVSPWPTLSAPGHAVLRGVSESRTRGRHNQPFTVSARSHGLAKVRESRTGGVDGSLQLA